MKSSRAKTSTLNPICYGLQPSNHSINYTHKAGPVDVVDLHILTINYYTWVHLYFEYKDMEELSKKIFC